MEDDVSTFGFKSAVLVVTARYVGRAPTEVNNTVLYYPSITQIMLDSQFEILWADNSGANLGSHPISNYAEGIDDAQKQEIIAQQCLMFNMLYL